MEKTQYKRNSMANRDAVDATPPSWCADDNYLTFYSLKRISDYKIKETYCKWLLCFYFVYIHVSYQYVISYIYKILPYLSH